MKITETNTLPLTLTDRAALGDNDVLTMPASFDDYLAFAETGPYPVEYVNGEIISMEQATFTHEALRMRIGALLYLLFGENEDRTILGSNIKIFVPATLPEKYGSFNADVSVVDGEPEYMTLPSRNLSTVTILNPVLVVEVLSDLTRNIDLGDKLAAYKQIPTLQQLLFINQKTLSVSTYIRAGVHTWTNIDFVGADDIIPVLGHNLAMAAIYRGML